MVLGSDFRHIALFHILLDPVQELHHGSAVLDMGVDRILDLCRILDCPEQLNRRSLVDDGVRRIQAGIERSACRIEIRPDRTLAECRKILSQHGIRTYGNAVFCKVLLHFRTDLFKVDVVEHPCLCDQRKGIGNRCGFNVIAADIQHPARILKTGQKQGVCALLLHCLTDTRNALLGGFTGILGRQNIQLVCRHIRTVLSPDRSGKILIHADLCVLCLQGIRKLARVGCADDTAVKAEHAVFRCLLDQEINRIGNAFLTQTHQGDTGTFQFVFRLREIASVGPETGKCLCDDHASRFSGKAGEEGFTAEIRRCVLIGQMIVLIRHIVNIDVPLLHQFSYFFDSFVYCQHV